MGFELGPNRYGKAGVHIATVTRREGGHDFSERMLDVRLEGDFDAVHVEGDNATGKSADEMLEALERRMGNDAETELAEASEQQRQIARLRLEKLVRPVGMPAPAGG